MSGDARHHRSFLSNVIEHVDSKTKQGGDEPELHAVLAEFEETINKSTRLSMLFSLMLEQVPEGKQYLHDPSGQMPRVRDTHHLMQLMNHVLTTAPHWTDAAHGAGLVGVPVNALLDWPMGTEAGFAVFQDPEVNAAMKKILNVWNEYLSSPASASVLGTDKEGWFSPTGKKALEDVANGPKGTKYSFEELYQCEPDKEHHGFKSWDDFFTRLYREGIRPVEDEDDDDVVANACESRTYKTATDVKARDKFWVKGQPYSVLDMLAFDPLADAFIGGTIYQAFLSALSYHRWHSPVSGTVKKAYVVDGTYFSEPLFEDFQSSAVEGDKKGRGYTDSNGECTSQEYISAVATRGIMFIESDNKKIGLMAVLAVGMTEVSTCEITVKEGDKVKKGDQLGMFHFGGSTHVLLFRKGVKVSGFPEKSDHNVPVRSKLCRVE